MQDDSTDAVTALYRLAAAQIELHDALLRLRDTCEQTAAAMRGTALGVDGRVGDRADGQAGDGAGDGQPGRPDHPDLVELDAMLTRFYG
jgi:hypothetical protein